MAAHRISTSPTSRGRLTPVARATWLVLAALAAAPVPTAWAQSAAAAEARRSFAVPAGPLDQALGRLGRQAGIQIAVNADLTAGLNSPGVTGSLTAAEALQQLLAGTGLQAVRDAGGEYTLRKTAVPGAAARPAAPDAAAALPTITVTGKAVKDGATEGSGSYTTRSMNSATKLPLSIRETPQSVSVITRQRMDDEGLSGLTDVVQQTAGLTLSQGGSLGSDSSPIYARGFTVENYQVDGVSHLHSNYSDIFQTNDMVLYDRVEIVRGATGLMNGIGTPSATINLIRKKPTDKFQGSLKAEAGSWDRYRVEADVSSPLNESGSLRGRGVLAWQDNGSYVERLKESHKIAYGVIEADLAPNTLLTAGLTWQQHDATGHSRGGLPLFNSDGTRTDWRRSDSAAASWAYSKRSDLAAFAALERGLDNGWKLKATYSFDRTSYDEQLGYAAGGAPDPATGAGVVMYAGRWAGPPVQHSLDLYASGPFTLFGRQHDLVVGTTLSHTREDSQSYHLWYFLDIPDIYTWNGSTPGMPDNSAKGDYNYTEMTKSAYATARFKPLDALSVIVGARSTSWWDDTYNRAYSGGDASDVRRAWNDQITPYAGVVFDLSRAWSIYASYTDIFKPQSSMDASGHYLDPLLGQAYELGSKAELFDGRLNLSAALYRIRQDNYAVAIPGVLAPDGSQAYRAESGASTRGFELELGGQILRHWQASIAFARNLTRDADGVLLNTEVPQNTFKLFTSYRLPEVGNGLTIGGGLRWQNRTWSDFTWMTGSPRVTQESYALVDLMAHYDITPQLSATLNVYNLFDKAYHTSASTSYYGEPRGLRLGATYRF